MRIRFLFGTFDLSTGAATRPGLVTVLRNPLRVACIPILLSALAAACSTTAAPKASDGAAGRFPITPGASIWFDGVEKASLVHQQTPVGPPLFLADGGSFPSACPDTKERFLSRTTYTFTTATRDFSWREDCRTDDGGAGPGATGQRALSVQEADTLVRALRAVVVVSAHPPGGDQDVAYVTTSIGADTWTYRDRQADGVPLYPPNTPVTYLAEALQTAHALAR